MEQIPHLFEVAETNASPPVRAVFGEIKKLSGVPIIALIYRHIATMPGVLEWAWEMLEPVMATGQLQIAAWDLSNGLKLPQVLLIPRVARRAVGISDEDDAEIGTVLSAFNRMNPVNAVAIRYLIRHLDAGKASYSKASGSTADWLPPAMLPDLPPMLSLEEIDRPVLELISWICHRDEGRHQGIWPSLYRYLARQPAFLAFASIVLAPHFVRVDQIVEDMRVKIQLVANSLPLYSSFHSTLREEIKSDLRRTIGEFSGLIPEMLMVGLLLEQSLAY